MLVTGARRRGRRGHEDPAWRPACAHVVGCRLARALVSTERADYLDGSMNADQALVRREHQPRAAAPAPPADALEGCDLFIGLSGARHLPRRGARRDEPRTRWSSRWPTRTPRSRPRRPRRYARIMATGPLGLPQPDQQRARLPRHLPRRARRPRARRSPRTMKMAAAARDRRDRRATTSCARTTSSRRSSTATWRRRSPTPSPRRRAPRAPRRPARDTIGFAAIDAERMRAS